MPTPALINRYIIRHSVVALLVVGGSLTLLVWLAQSLRFIDWIMNRGVSLQLFLQLTFLLVPSLLLVVVPFSLVIAVVYTYNRLDQDSELPVMVAMGLGPLSLIRPALIVAAGCTVVLYAITLWGLPHSYRAFKDKQHLIRSQHGTAMLQDGTFIDAAPGITVYVGRRTADGWMARLFVEDSRLPGKTIIYTAENGRFDTAATPPTATLLRGYRQEVDTGTHAVSWLYFDQYTVDIPLAHTAPAPRLRDNRKELYIGELLSLDDSTLPPEKLASLKSEIHSRILTPWLPIVMTITALSMLLSRTGTRRKPWKRISAGIAVSIGVYALFFASQQLTPGGIVALPYITLYSMLGVGILLLYKPWRWLCL